MSTTFNDVGLNKIEEANDEGDSDPDKRSCIENWIKGEITTVDMCSIMNIDMDMREA